MTFDRTDAEALIFRAAVIAFTFYPDKHLDEPGYTIDEDLEWCAELVAGLPSETQKELIEELRMLVLDPALERQGFIKRVLSLADK